MKQRDITIIGSGLGGLACGAILSKEGYRVIVLEKNPEAGGCLQSFRRGGHILDTGLHYVGSLDEGQTMHQYFKYFGILHRLRMRKLDETAFDVITFGDGREYYHAMGYRSFEETLVSYFPEERKGIGEYCKLLQKVGELIKPDVLRDGQITGAGSMAYTGLSVVSEIGRLVGNPVLRNVLAGSCSLYGGNREMASVYQHAMINHSNIEGAYCFVGGTQHIADAFVEVIEQNGGEVRTNAEVTKLILNNDHVQQVEINHNELMETSGVISDIHPRVTFNLLENNSVIRKAYFTRINSLPNSYGLFTIYLIMKPGSCKYINRNYYLHATPDAWATESMFHGFNIPSVLMCMQADTDKERAKVVTLLMPMNYNDIRKWENTVSGRRGAEYENFKSEYAGAVIAFVKNFFPDIIDGIQKIYTSTPLTYRDYTYTPEGSAYGIVKNCHNPIVSMIPTRTKIDNLYLTGQNVNIHGALGVSITAAVTCSEFLGMEYLAKKIGNA